jgi:hypothetical protein
VAAASEEKGHETSRDVSWPSARFVARTLREAAAAVFRD